MSDDLVFFTNPMSRGRTVRWMLEEIGQPYRTEILDYGTTMKAPDYLRINPMGKVPALKHGEQVVTEVAAICVYLADAFPQAGLAPPPGDRLRAPYYRWFFFSAGPVEYAAFNRKMGYEAKPEHARSMGYGTLEQVVDVLDGALSSRDYLVGESFTAADLYVGAQLGFSTQFGFIEPRPSFQRYIARITQRPAFQRAAKLDGALPAG